MTRLILETSLLLLGAYFLGAWAACLVKRSFFATAKLANETSRFEAASASARRGAIPPQAPISPPVRRADPKPIALETIERTSPQAAADAANRFEEVLTKAPAMGGAMQAAKPAPSPPAPPANATAPLGVAAPGVAPVATPPVRTSDPATVTVPMPPAVSAQQVASVVPARLDLAAASSTSGPASVAVPIAAAAATSATDDLTRIRSIDPAVSARLIELGVGRYRDVAAWLPGDVARISKALGFSGRIEQENWIEQAQILARGGETAYARSKDRGETTAPPVINESVQKPAATQVVAPAVATTTLPHVSDRAAFAQSADAPVREQKSAQVGASDVAKMAGVGDETSRTTEPGLAGAAASAAAAGLGTLTSTMRDNLQRIGGINAEVEKLLNTQSVNRYAQVASWTAADAMRFDRLLGQEGRVKRENWIEQAQILSRGGDTAYSRQFDQRHSPAGTPSHDVARPSRLSDAIRDTAAKTVAEPASTQRPADMSGLRSVRSEAYAGAGQIGGSKSAQVDDLKRVRGVGVLIET